MIAYDVDTEASLKNHVGPGGPAPGGRAVRLYAAGRRVVRGGSEARLTPIQFRLLSVLARARGRPVAKEDLLAEVWGFAYDTNLVEVHVRGLRRRLEPLGRGLIVTERGIGYALR